MRALDHRYWPIWVAIVLAILAAGIDSLTQSVPVWLTCSAALAAWTAGWCISSGNAHSAGGGLVSALLLSALAVLLLVPLWAAGLLAAGSVLAGMALGGWIGCAVPPQRGALWLVAGVVTGGLLMVLSGWTFALYGMNAGALAQVFPPQAALSAGCVLSLAAMLRLAEREKPSENPPAAGSLSAG